MSRGGHAPVPLLALGASACTLAFATDHPLVVMAVAAGALALHLATPARSVLPLLAGAVVGLGVALLNPFVQANGDLILMELPDIPVLDLQVTFEEVVAGLVMGARAFAVTVIITSVLGLVDPDRLLALAARLLPRSALAASIAARMLPTLARDARSLTETARLRGLSPVTGPWRRRAGVAGTLALPLVGSALERSLDVAEAMAARGYGAGPRTRLREAPFGPTDRIVLALAIPVAALAGLAIAGSFGAYRFYPTLDPVTDSWGLPVAALATMALAAAASVLRR